MAGEIERRADGSIALFIRGDLQFDSADERIYHESLVLPALAIAQKRLQTNLRALVIGGGDGLVARELFKSSQVSKVDLVDYDPEILAFAQNDFASLNDGSLSDDRMCIHIKDAWDFVEEAHKDNISYDIIVSDLTVAEDVASARFHSIDWYTILARLLTPKGALAVNAVSPQATPEAYWCIFNSMIKGGFHPRAYHVHIPSFTAQGYGQDWGRFVASTQPITPDELDETVVLAEPRHFLKDANHMLELFEFPEALFDFQASSLPARAGSDILLRYFQVAKPMLTHSGTTRSAFTFDTLSVSMPDPDDNEAILTSEISSAVAKAIYSQNTSATDQSQNAQMFLYGVLDLMPSLNRQHTQEVIEDFLADPESFLQAVDLPGLVTRLLKRAVELPSQLVVELELLRDKLCDWAGDPATLFNLTERVVTIIVLVIVIGNLLYPDMAYGKGHAAPPAAAAGHRSAPGARGARGARGRRGYGGGYYGGGWNGPGYVYQNRVIKQTKVVPGQQQHVPKGLQVQQFGRPRNDGGVAPGKPSGMLPINNNLGNAEYVDENGRTYPARRYRFNSTFLADASYTGGTSGGASPANVIAEGSTEGKIMDSYAVYRLGPGADILSSGHVTISLTDQSYLLVTNEAMHLVDQQNGSSIMPLRNDENLLSMLAAEISRQYEGLDAEHPATNHLSTAREIIACIPNNSENVTKLHADDEAEVFPSVWITAKGKYLSFKLSSDQTVYVDRKETYSDEGRTPIAITYPSRAVAQVITYLSKVVRDVESTENRLLKDKRDLTEHLTVLGNELTAYKSADSAELVKYGSRLLSQAEAIRLTELAISRATHQAGLLDECLEQLPAQTDLARIALASLASGDA